MKTRDFIIILGLFFCTVLCFVYLYCNISKLNGIQEKEYLKLCNQYYDDIVLSNTFLPPINLNKDLLYIRINESECNSCKKYLLEQLSSKFDSTQFVIVTDSKIGVTENYSNVIESQYFVDYLDNEGVPYIIFYNKIKGEFIFIYLRNDFEKLIDYIINKNYFTVSR